jgi:ribosome-associated protein
MPGIRLHRNLTIPVEELEITAVRSGGSGGQNVNKVSTAVQIRLDIPASSLPERVKRRLLDHADQRISSSGTIVIKAQSHRSQRMNRREALERLRQLFAEALLERKTRRATRPGRGAVERRLSRKKQRGRLKDQRRQRDFD